MSFSKKIDQVQTLLKDAHLDGWLLYDFQGKNSLACQFLELPESSFLSRRFFYWIPQQGDPIKIVHAVEAHVLEHVLGKTEVYDQWQTLEHYLKTTLQGIKKVAMEFSFHNKIPYLSLVDAGTVDWIRSFGIEVVSSSDLLSHFIAILSDSQLSSHLKAADVLDQTAKATWELIRTKLHQKQPITEHEVQQFMFHKIKENHCILKNLPFCAVNANAANPHYTPSSTHPVQIQEGDVVLIDLWCKENKPHSIYADITRMAVAKRKPTAREQEIFSALVQAQKTVTEFIRTKWKKQALIRGCDVDNVCREVIEKRGFGNYFIHRTGHNIYTEDHGPGTHVDGFETLDERPLVAKTCFSIEPGIYIPGEVGMRLEYDIYLHPDGEIQVTGGIQEELVLLV